MMFYKETNFKETTIGRIPSDWDVINLGKVFTLKNGERLKIAKDSGFPVYGANGVMGYSSNFLVDNDFTIVIGRVGASGEVHLAKGKTWISDNAIYSKNYDRDKACPAFIYYLLKFRQLAQFASKTTHPIITQSFLNIFPIQLPPLPEQQRVAEVLSTVDEAIRKTSEVIAKTERLKKGLMQELLTKGLGHKEFKDTEIGRIPKQWELARLEDVANYINGCAFSPRDWKTEGLPIIRIHNLNDPNAEFNYFDGEINERYVIENDDLLFSWSASMGAYIWNRGKAVLNQHIFKVIPNERVEKLFLYYLLFLVIERLKSRVHGSTMKHFKRGELKTLIPLPPLPEQKAVAQILSTVDKKLELERNEKAKLERIKHGLMDLLLTGKVRVKVN